MPQRVILKARGLHTDANQLTSVPEGALVTADNVFIDRDDVIEPRRGFSKYGNTFGTGSDRAKQLLIYKERILFHYDNKLLFDDSEENEDGNFLEFDGIFEEVSPDLRIRSFESNKNLYFTTADGIKKISAKTANDFTTSPNFIIDAGAAKALDVTGSLNSTTDGFLPGNSEVAYRVVWGYTDANNNLLLGSPSSRLVITNFNETSANVDLTFTIPQNVTSDYFYQIYRTAVFTAVGSLTLDDIDPGDEMQLVIEDFPTTAQLASGIVEITDIAPEDFRQGGLFLYTNPNSGDGIDQANEPPPKAHDITMYQNTLFYANTESRARTTLALLGVGSLINGTSYISIDDSINPARLYTFVGSPEITEFDYSAYSGTIPADLDGKYCLFNAAGNVRKYYMWYDNTKTTQTIDFSSYVGIIPDDLDGRYFLLYTQDEDTTYYVWFDATGSTIDPGTTSSILTGLSGIRVDISSGVATKADLANETQSTIATNDINSDFDISYTGGNEFFTIETESFDESRAVTTETIQKGFSYNVNTPINSDPANDLITNTDVVGRIGIRVNISRNVSTVVHVADASAAAILEQDLAGDFTVNYTGGNDFFEITTTNNGHTDDARDSEIVANQIANGFVVTVTSQGDGENLLGSITATTTGATITITSADHNLSNGDTITITGSDTTPSIDGTHTVASVTRDTFDITPSSPVTVAGTTGNWIQADNHVLLSNAPSPAQQIDETARSLVTVINKDSNSSVYAFYTSGAQDLPGQILLEVKDIGTNQFTVTADSASTGALFNPPLPPVVNAQPVMGEAEIKPNRIYFAKLQQPEAVPILNFIDVGPEDKAISRILALRESLFILKEDGVYRLTGLDGNFTVDLFDESTKIIAPDTAVVLNNQIYCLTNQGVVVISDTGVSIISRQIDNLVKLYSSSNYDFQLTSFGVSYETDRAYILFLPTNTTDTVATQAFRYSTSTDTWTRYNLSKTCGLINPGNDKLYLGPSDENFIEQERKNFKRTDYADRDFSLTIPANAINETLLKLSSTQLVDIGDALVQTQYLTINEYNQLLAKLDLDPGTGAPESTRFDFTAYTESVPNDLHGKYFILYSASDAQKYGIFYDAQGDLPSLDPSIFTDLLDAQQIRVDISSGVSTLADVAQKTSTAISTATFDFVTTYIATNTFFDTVTTRNGDTTDASDSNVNGLNDGFVISILSQGVGDYLDNLGAVNGDNLTQKLNSLALELDNDPGVSDADYLASIGTHSDIGSTIISGDPTIINSIGHNLQDGRLVTIINSTSTPNIDGQYIVTKIDADNFSIPIETTVGGTCDWSAGLTTFPELQGAFNTIVNKLNNDAGVFYQNYLLSEGSKDFEVLIIDKSLNNTTDVILQFETRFIEGEVTLFKGIPVEIIYTPEIFGDPSISKHVREGTFIFEDSNFSRGTVGYRTDLSPGFETTSFSKAGKGDWSLFAWSEHNWGGGFSGVPFRTYLPLQKQRCRYTQAQFIHDSAREKFSLYGISYTFRPLSERAYRS